MLNSGPESIRSVTQPTIQCYFIQGWTGALILDFFVRIRKKLQKIAKIDKIRTKIKFHFLTEK